MRYVTFVHKGEPRVGIVKGGEIHPLPASAGTMLEYLGLSKRERKALATKKAIPLKGARLLAPIRPCKNVFAVGRNYKGHAEEIARARGIELKLPTVPTFFTKASTAVADPEQVLHLSPDVSPEYDWEAELAIVIGKRCRDVPKEKALSVVFGYMCLNDVTARDLQREHGQWFKGKSLDETCPMGPWIVGTDEISDPGSLDIALRLNGETKQHANTSDLIFDVATIIESLSRGMTLEPGDVIATGTPDGVGFARTPPEFLKDGDVMEVEIERIGVLRNTVSIKGV